MGTVNITKVQDSVIDSLVESINLIGGLEQFIGHDDKVMVKPNLNDTQLVTDIRLTEALIRLLKEYGVREIVIAESTFGDGKLTEMLFNKSGYQEMAKKMEVRLINLNNSDVVEVKVKEPMATDSLKIAKEVFEVDRIINLPVMKVHYATGVTLSMKNLKGLLVGEEKRRFHDIGLDKAIVDLNNTVKPTFNIIDGIHCMERMGPKGGDIKELNLLVTGRDAAETDYAASCIMGYDIHEIKHIKLFAKMNNLDFSRIKITGEALKDLKVQIKKVQMDGNIPEHLIVQSQNACSSCMNALILSCQVLDRDVSGDINVFIGDGWEEKEKGTSYTQGIAFGNCASKSIKNCFCVKGCPPFPFKLKKLLEERFNV